MSKKTFYIFLLSVIFFNLHMSFYYNYDMGEFEGYSYSHDRDKFIQYSKFNIDSGNVVYETVDIAGYPYNSETAVRDEVPYPRGFHSLLTSVSLITNESPLFALLLLSFAFVIQLIMVTAICTSLIYKKKEIICFSLISATFIPTLGTIHGPLLPLPSTICTFLILVNFSLFIRAYQAQTQEYKGVMLVFTLGLLISLLHRPSTIYSVLFFIPFIFLKLTRLHSLFTVIGASYGLGLNSLVFTESDFYSLTRIPSLYALILLVMLVSFLLMFIFLHREGLRNHFTSSKITSSVNFFYLIYSPTVLILFFLIFIFSFISDNSMRYFFSSTYLFFYQ